MGITAHFVEGDPIFIGSWKGYQKFIDALEQIGSDQFPMILAQLPEGDEGFTSAEKAEQMMVELKRFEQLASEVEQVVLVDSEREADISMGSHIRGGTLAMDRQSGYDLGFDNQGFFVKDRWEMNRVLFQAMRVEQRLIHPETLTVEYINREDGQSFQCSTPFGQIMSGNDGMPRMFVQFFHVEIRDTQPNRFAYITRPLEQALERAIDTAQTIEWI